MRLYKKRILFFGVRRRTAVSENAVFTVFVILLTVIFCFLSLSFILRVRPVIIALAQSKARYIAICEVENAVSDIIKTQNIGYSSLMEISTNSDGEVMSVSAKSVEIAEIKAQLVRQINDNIDRVSETEIYLPVGTLFANELLEGVGPKLKIASIATGSVYADIKSEFVSSGINQTLHKVFFEIRVSMSVIIKGKSYSDDVTACVPVAETLIIGDVPDTYTNISEAGEAAFEIGTNMIG